MEKLLKNKKAVITGGTSGIGEAIAILFAENGADVAIIGTNEEKAKKVFEKLNEKKVFDEQNFFYYLADVSSTEVIEKTFLDIYKDLKDIDILVNNAGITKDGFLMKMSEENWDRVINVNLKSAYNTCKAVIRNMMKNQKGKIINVSSIVGIMGNAFQTNYAASKAGLIGFTKSLAKEAARKKINVNCIAPGFVETKMTENLSEDVKKDYLSKIPLNRMGMPKEIALAALFLASDMSDYITGQVLTVDGGMVM